METVYTSQKQACADDIVLVARNMPALEEMLNTAEECGRRVELIIHTKLNMWEENKSAYRGTKDNENWKL